MENFVTKLRELMSTGTLDKSDETEFCLMFRNAKLNKVAEAAKKEANQKFDKEVSK